MPAANQSQVRLAIEKSRATGTAAEVLATIEAQSIEKTDATRKVYSDVATRLNTLGLPGNAIVDAIRDDLLANGPKWVCDQLGGSGIDFSHPDLQSQIDSMLNASPPRLNPQIAAILKGMGRWNISPLENVAGRGATTDEATVQQVLDAIAAEAAAEAERQAQAAEEAARRALIAERHVEIARRWNLAYAVVEAGGTVEDAIAVFGAA